MLSTFPTKEECVTLFTAAGDPARLQIVFLLVERGRMTVGDIASHFHLSRPAISHHLKVLKDARVVRRQKLGKEVYCWLDHDYIITTLRAIADHLELCVSAEPGANLTHAAWFDGLNVDEPADTGSP